MSKKIETVWKFLQSARNLVKNKNITKDQVIAFAKQQFGEIDDFFKLQIDNLFKKPKVSSIENLKNTRKADVVPIKKKIDDIKISSEQVGSLDEFHADFVKETGINIPKENLKQAWDIKKSYPFSTPIVNKNGKFIGQEATQKLYPESKKFIVKDPNELKKEIDTIKDEGIMSTDDYGSAMAEWARKNDPEGYAKMQKVADDLNKKIDKANKRVAAKEALEKRTDDIMKEDIGEEEGIITLSKDLEKKGKDLKKTLDENKKTSETAFENMFDAMSGFRRATGSKDKAKPFQTPGMPYQRENPGYRTLGGSMYAEGNLRTAMREFLRTEHKAGRLKLDEQDLFRITEYSPMSADDPIDVFRRHYGENALEAADAMAKKLEKGTSFKNYEEIFRANMPELKVKTQGAGLYDQSIIDAERVLKEAKDQADYAKTLDEFDITNRTKNAKGGRVGLRFGSIPKILEYGPQVVGGVTNLAVRLAKGFMKMTGRKPNNDEVQKIIREAAEKDLENTISGVKTPGLMSKDEYAMNVGGGSKAIGRRIEEIDQDALIKEIEEFKIPVRTQESFDFASGGRVQMAKGGLIDILKL